MKKLFYLIFLMCFLILYQNSNGQEVVGSSGDYFQGNDMSISWTIGEVLTETFISDNLQLTQGMHQPPISVTGIEWFSPNKLSFDIYPNPTTAFVNIKVPDKKFGKIQYQLFNTEGSIIGNGELKSDDDQIDFTKVPNQLYVLKFLRDNIVIGQCKVIKK